MSFRKHPDAEWPGFPYLKREDIQSEHFQKTPYISQSMVENRYGRVVVRMEGSEYQKFLAKVKRVHGSIAASNVEKVVMEAIRAWIKDDEEE